MSDSRKRSRKSKIEVREDDCELEVVCDDVNSDVQHLQLAEPPGIVAKRLKKAEYYPEVPFIPDHDYCWPFTASEPITYSNFDKPDHIKLPKPSGTTIDGLTKTPQGSSGNQVKIKVDNLPKFHVKGGVVEKMENINTNNKGNDNCKMRMCKYVPELLFEASKKIAETSDNLADLILDVEMRNQWGNVLYTPNEVPAQEWKLQAAICTWQAWYKGSRFVREAPLFYQCHICEQAWWRLQPFRDHIRQHDGSKLLISMKEHLHESFIIASYEIVNQLIYIPIDGNCYRCGEDVEFHKVNYLAYSCSRCSKSVYTCTGLKDHESVCLYANLVMFNISLDRQCILCKKVLNSASLVQKHMIEAHSVRSDIPVYNSFKNCIICGEKYFTYTMHNCSKSGRNCCCTHCCRKFASTKLMLNHSLSCHNRPVCCRICNMQLKAKCQEMEHLVENHTSNYRLVLNCTVCWTSNVLFMDEKSFNLHRLLGHQKKVDRRRLFYEKMLVPKSCLDGDYEEEATLIATKSKKSKKQAQKKTEDTKLVDPSLPSKSFSDLTAEVEVTVDEIDVKKEPIDIDENQEVGYEEMLLKMFNESPRKPVGNTKVASTDNTAGDKKIIEENKAEEKRESVKFDHVYKTEDATEFDYGSVKVKAEPIDDIDIIENPVEEVQIKTEPMDPSEIDDEMMNVCYDYGEASVKIERNYEPDDCSINEQTLNEPTGSRVVTSGKVETSKEPTSNVVTDDEDKLIIKEEFDDTITVKTDDTCTSSEPFHELLTELEMFRDDKKKKKKKLDYEYSIEVIDSKGKLKQRKMYTCRKCGYTAHHNKYKKHMDTTCLVSPGVNCNYPCSICGLTFVMFKNYVLHFEKHGYDLMCCFICGARFTVEFKFLKHMHKHVKSTYVGVHLLDKSGEEIKRSQKRVTCMNCKTTVDQDTMFSHWEKQHLKLKEIKSDDEEPRLVIKEEPAPELTVDCERVTMNNKELDPAMLKLATDNLQLDSNDKECIICYRVFTRRYDLKRHIVEHLLMDAHMKKIKYRDFRCQICSEGFPHPERYKFHMRGHGNMPIFMCELCNKTFSDSSNFAKHKKTHNVRCLVCDICKKKFHSKTALEKHIGEHYTLPMTSCMYCSKTFHSKTTYKKHKYQVHQKPRYRCILCDVFFATSQIKWDHDWEVHQLRKHKADCPICKKSFRKFADVKVHARSEHSAKIRSVICVKSMGKKEIKLSKDLKEKERIESAIEERE